MGHRLKIIAWVLLAGLTAGVAFWLLRDGRNGGVAYRLAAVERGPITSAVSTTGTLNAVITVIVGSQVSGQIKELLADFNSEVEAGQVVARIDPEVFDARVRQAEAELAVAKANVAIQRAGVERSQQELANAIAARNSAKAQTDKARVTLDNSRRNRDRRKRIVPLRRDIRKPNRRRSDRSRPGHGAAQDRGSR